MAITEWCRRAKDLAKQITSRTRIRQELEKYNKGIIDLEQLTSFTKPKLQDAINLSAEVVGIIRLDARNDLVTGCGFGSEFNLNRYPVSGYVHNDTVLSSPVLMGNRSLILVSAPIVNRMGERQGTDLVMIDLVFLEKIVADSEPIGTTSEMIVGYRSGNQISPLFSPL